MPRTSAPTGPSVRHPARYDRRNPEDGMLTLDTICQAPKALLHDHLDGGLRPATIVDLAREFGYRELPTDDVDALAAHIRRVAAECAEDLAADGVAYAEVRFAPELHVERGLTTDEVVGAVAEGFREGE